MSNNTQCEGCVKDCTDKECPVVCKYISEAERVKQFTEESSGIKVPSGPQLMSKKEVNFIVKMVIDELLELYATVEKPDQSKYNMISMICAAKNIDMEEGSNVQLIASQADAFVDINYYMLNAAAKKGINLAKVFDVVHNANMDKKDPNTGTFLKREDGKILKREGWQEPDITGEIVRQQKEGAF